METNTEQIGNVLKIKVVGRLVAGCAEEFKQMLMTATKTSHQILLDLSQMNYIDSSGWRTWASGYT